MYALQLPMNGHEPCVCVSGYPCMDLSTMDALELPVRGREFGHTF